MKRIIFTVTNDLNYDQRMHRIASTLVREGYDVLLVGRIRKDSTELSQQLFQQKRLRCFWNKGVLFYAEYNFRLLVFLLFQKTDIICAIDLDTILPCYFSSILKRQKRVYDAHELFTEQFEIIRRPFIKKCWLLIEKWMVKRFKNGYTVNEFISNWLSQQYGVQYDVIKNLPTKTTLQNIAKADYILYQGSVNEGRCFDELIEAMLQVNARLVICGNGNYYDSVKELIRKYQLEDKVVLKGNIAPEALRVVTEAALIGITLFDKKGLNQYQSLANRFFDYMMAGIPQICVDYPEYRSINDKYGFALLVEDTDTDSIAKGLNKLLTDTVLYKQIVQKALKARLELNWETESEKLIQFYQKLN
nr:glycosyltransferase family 4 protein [uncultured Sediminibacterium sp.]